MKLLSEKMLLRNIQSELNSLKKIKVEETDNSLLDKKIKKAKAMAYLITVALQVLEADKYQSEIENLQREIEELKDEEKA